MSEAAHRLALARSLMDGRGLRVANVGHSIGSTINIGAGRTTPSRYAKYRRDHRRPGYYQKAPYDLFLMSANWEVASKTGYRLRWNDNAARIAKESAKLVGSRIHTVDAPRFRNRVRFVFRGGLSLTVWPDEADMHLGWTLERNGRHFSLRDSE